MWTPPPLLVPRYISSEVATWLARLANRVPIRHSFTETAILTLSAIGVNREGREFAIFDLKGEEYPRRLARPYRCNYRRSTNGN